MAREQERGVGTHPEIVREGKSRFFHPRQGRLVSFRPGKVLEERRCCVQEREKGTERALAGSARGG